MSLINDMLRELQTRQVAGGLPLADLEPVGPGQQQRRLAKLSVPIVALVLVLPLYLVSGSVAEQKVSRQVLASASGGYVVARRVAEPEHPPLAGERQGPREDHAQATLDENASAASSDQQPPLRPVLREAASTPVLQVKAEPEAVMNTRPARGAEVSASNEQSWRDAVSRDPQDGTAWIGLYDALLDDDEGQAAEAAILEGFSRAADPSLLASRYARVLISRGELSAALSLLQDHNQPGAFDEEREALLAWLLQSTQRHREAADAYRTLVARNSQLGDWWVGLAISLENIGNRDGALQAYERARGSVQIKATLARYAKQRIAALTTDG